MRLFLVAAVVLIVFAIVAAANASGTLFGVEPMVWFFASFLSFLVDVLWPIWIGGGPATDATGRPIGRRIF